MGCQEGNKLPFRNMHAIPDSSSWNTSLTMHSIFEDFRESSSEECFEFMGKINKLKEMGVDISKIKKRPDTERYYIYLSKTQNNISAGSQKELIDKVYNKLFNYTLAGILDEYSLYRKHHTALSDKSIKEQRRLFNTYWKDSSIAKKALKSLKANDFILFFQDLTKNRDYTRKQFNDIKSPISQMLYYAVTKEYISHNILRDIDFNQFTYKDETDHKKRHEPYAPEERIKMISFLLNQDALDGYDQAIFLQLMTGCRIGEIKGIMKEDVLPNDYVFIRRQNLDIMEMNDDFSFEKTRHVNVDHVKAHSKKGKRKIKLPPEAARIIDTALHQNPNCDLLFSYNGNALCTCTYNRRLKKICKELDIEYHPSHQIRFSCAGTLLDTGIPLEKIQTFLGHTTSSMTLYYLKSFQNTNVVSDDVAETLSIMGMHEHARKS